jgi:hypothetical protein
MLCSQTLDEALSLYALNDAAGNAIEMQEHASKFK